MKRLFTTMLALGVVALLSGPVMAHEEGGDPAENDANPNCSASDAACVDTDTADPDNAAGFGGVVAAGGDAESQQGYVFADGNGNNVDPLDGYIGLTSQDGGPIGATDGHAHRGDANSPLSADELPMP